jgi:hypothetical protein
VVGVSESIVMDRCVERGVKDFEGTGVGIRVRNLLDAVSVHKAKVMPVSAALVCSAHCPVGPTALSPVLEPPPAYCLTHSAVLPPAQRPPCLQAPVCSSCCRTSVPRTPGLGWQQARLARWAVLLLLPLEAWLGRRMRQCSAFSGRRRCWRTQRCSRQGGVCWGPGFWC